MVVAVVAVALGVALCRDGERWDRKSQQGCGDGSRRTVWLVIAALGLLLTTLFRVVIVARYILPNWTVVSDVWRWADWIASYPDRDSVLDPIRPPDGFLEGYHIAADGVPVAQAVLGPLGILVSLVAVVFLSGMGRAWGPAPRISAEPRK
ncbi:hypothetical protein VTK73DRAFT_9070 [Phialemonium thermophilum]|uniref:Uncharacterized protein n=1 Tax=Phialemonium thermophilum TaxID=223376 RepID=A0ABR3W4R6_9PEZI